ncbi:ABC transporter ATP-binding protein [Kaustia mangrovi]|uniref:ABC transporter ATP-binding protein n=1 Tax=Kaustia mangrovi TaxID=2593653 RepID=A0A7S8C7E3_9HYPH|nr:ABC transporter ATP-binding protein [Kaustia mangrovi]QPC44707.1 ABC transporter ATP-binding protein [Kaustia mangrovi]
MADVQLQATGIRKLFGGFVALDDISIDIERGEFLTLLGPSGSGKTTFLNILAGFEAPTGGRLLQDGTDITHRPAEERDFGMVFQGYALFPHMTVERNVAFPLRVRKVAKAEQAERVAKALEVVGLSAHAGKRPSELSGGQQQRVALARAIVFEPDMLLLDEPLSALDKNLREQLQEELQRIHREIRTTFVFVTHDQSEALALSSRVAIFNHGRLQQIGAPDEVYTRPASRFVAEFLGQINLFPLSAPQNADGVVAGGFAGRTLKAPGKANGAGVLLGVRPEHVSIAERPDENANAIEAQITGIAYHGPTVAVTLAPNAGAEAASLSLTLPAEIWAMEGYERGRSVWLTWPVEKGLVLAAED